MLLDVAGGLLVPRLTADMINIGVKTGNMEYIIEKGIAMLAVTILAGTGALLGSWLCADLSAKLGRDMRNAVYEKSLTFSEHDFSRFGTGSMITRTLNDINIIQQSVVWCIQMVLPVPAVCIMGVGMAFAVDTVMGFLLIGVTALIIVLALLAVFFIFPLYWILTGSLKDAITINAQKPQWFPLNPTLDNYVRLFKQPAIQWLLNTIIIAVAAMALTCITAALAGYALAKKRFYGQTVLFSLLVCAMALPKQVIVIPLLQEMSALGLNNNLLAVILPTVGWPFGIFLMKQFSETIPTEMLEAARIDGASEVRTFVSIVFPMVKPGVGALAIFTFVNTWNDYFLQLIMLQRREVLTISTGIARLQGEVSSDFGLIMAGAALAAVPIVAVFLMFQKYFTQGITMGAVKG